jgi:hypothetical protein
MDLTDAPARPKVEDGEVEHLPAEVAQDETEPVALPYLQQPASFGGRLRGIRRVVVEGRQAELDLELAVKRRGGVCCCATTRR